MLFRSLAWRVWNGDSIDLTMGYVNQIWQGDANAYLCQLFPLCTSPAAVINMTGAQVLSTRAMATRLGELMGREPHFVHREADDALLGNAERLFEQLGTPQVSVEHMLQWMAYWVQLGGKSLGKPTKYESRSGKF